MKLTQKMLKQIIKEELQKIITEGDFLGYSKEQIEEFGNLVGGDYNTGKKFIDVWNKDYDWVLEDEDDVYMFLNSADVGRHLKPPDYKRYADKLQMDGIKKILKALNIQLPTYDPTDALKIFRVAKYGK